MNKQEFNELKRLYALNRCSITQIAGCYVNGGEKEIKSTWQQPFLSMDEEDMLKYFEIFRKVLSGKVGKTEYEIPFTEVQKQQDMQYLVKSKLKSDNILSNFYQRIINSFEYVGNYLILVIHDVYDVPGQTRDGIDMEDASENIYEYIVCCICPASLQMPCLAYDDKQGKFTRMERDWIVKEPTIGFLYPAFNDRQEDDNHLEYFIKKAKEEEIALAEKLFGYKIGLPEESERQTFCCVIENTLGAEATLEQICEIERKLNIYVDLNMPRQGEMKIGKSDLWKILQKCDLSKKQLDRFEKKWDEDAGEITELSAAKIMRPGTLTINTPAGTVRIGSDYAYDVSVENVSDKKCLVINLNGKLEVNGIDVPVVSEEWEE